MATTSDQAATLNEPGKRRPRRKPAPPESRKLTLSVPEPVHATMQQLADDRQIPVTELLRRAFVTYRVLDTLLSQNPSARIALDGKDDGPTLELGDLVPVGRDAW